MQAMSNSGLSRLGRSVPESTRRLTRMSSQALVRWSTHSHAQLDELVDAHAAVGGIAPGRRYATAQLNASIVVQIAAHFQLFCRDLHSELAQLLVAAAPAAYQPMLRVAFTNRRGLDRGNAWAQTIQADFGRFDLDLWTAAQVRDVRTAVRRTRLQQLNTWRNAIGHQDFVFSPQEQTLLANTVVTLPWARRWRCSCNALATTFDRVAAEHVVSITGISPW